MTTPGQDLRGDASLLKAIATGSPVATNGKQEGELCEWQIQHHDRFHRVYNRANTQQFDLLYIDDAARLYQVLNAFASLRAYAKAHELRAMWIEGDPRADQHSYKAFYNHLRTMGYAGGPDGYTDFLKDYRAAALAKAGGR
jgi:hypothetical protein